MFREQILSPKKFNAPICGSFRFASVIRILVYFIAVIVFSILSVGNTYASNQCEVEVARFVSVQGIIEVRRVAKRQANDWQRVDMDTVICLGDMIRSRMHSRAAIRLSNNSMLRLDQRSSMTFIPEEEKIFFDKIDRRRYSHYYPDTETI